MNLDNLITSQDFTNDEIVAKKRTAGDYGILVSPEFEFEGAIYRVLLDGHHSLAAAIADSVEPDITEATAMDHDAVGLIRDGNIDDFLSCTWMGSDYRYALTGKFVW